MLNVYTCSLQHYLIQRSSGATRQDIVKQIAAQRNNNILNSNYKNKRTRPVPVGEEEGRAAR